MRESQTQPRSTKQINLRVDASSVEELRTLAANLGYKHERGRQAPQRPGNISKLFDALARGDLQIVART